MHVEQLKKLTSILLESYYISLSYKEAQQKTPVTNKNAIFSSKNCFKLESYVELTPYTTKNKLKKKTRPRYFSSLHS